MARSFNGTTQWLTMTALPVSAVPLSFAGFAKVASLPGGFVGILNISNNSSTYYALTMNTSGGATAILNAGAGTGQKDNGSTAAGAWHHYGASFSGSTTFGAAFDGNLATVVGVTAVPGGLTHCQAGTLWSGGAFLGAIQLAELACWNVVLSVDEWIALWRGFSPALIRPLNLKGYWPCLGNDSPEKDVLALNNFTLNNTPTKTDHPPLYRKRNKNQRFYANPQNIIALSPLVVKIVPGAVAPQGRVALQSIIARITLSSAVEPRVVVQKLIACISPETFENHFLSRAWASPDSQVVAGYPRYCQPMALTGSYEEIVDFGGVFSNVIINLNWAFNTIVGSVTISPKIATSTDGITYTALVSGSSQFAQSVRYVKVHFDFVASDDKSIAEFFNLQVLLDVKNEIDGGEGDALAADGVGTVVNFTKEFKSVKSITVSAKSATEVKAVYDFTSTPNPTGFKVLLFNAAGARVDGHFSWKARGVI